MALLAELSARLQLIVSIRFQVLFHSPPGVLFTFPSRYSSLSVTDTYLALPRGRGGFQRYFSCTAVLGWQSNRTKQLTPTGLSPPMAAPSNAIRLH